MTDRRPRHFLAGLLGVILVATGTSLTVTLVLLSGGGTWALLPAVTGLAILGWLMMRSVR